MPDDGGPPQPGPFGEQLAMVLSERDVSLRELARRLAAADGTKIESKRRWLGKYLSGKEVTWPQAAGVAAIEKALAVRRGYFKRPDPEPRATRAVWQTRTDDRLAVLEEKSVRVEDLRPMLRALQLLATGKRSEALRVLSEAGEL